MRWARSGSRGDEAARLTAAPLAASRLPFLGLVVYDHDLRWNPLAGMARLAAYEAMRWVPRVEGADLWARAVRAAGWWLPYERACVVADRPEIVHTEQGRGGHRRRPQRRRAGGPLPRRLALLRVAR